MNEDNEGFRKLKTEQTIIFGPNAVLLCGFALDEFELISGAVEKTGAVDHAVIYCTESMVGHSLKSALECSNYYFPPVPADRLPRVLIMSGMNDEQIRDLLNHFPPELSRPIFATATPNNMKYTVRDLLMELLQEHKAMAASRKKK